MARKKKNKFFKWLFVLVLLGVVALGGLFSFTLYDDYTLYAQTGESFDFNAKTVQCSNVYSGTPFATEYPTGVQSTNLWDFVFGQYTGSISAKGNEQNFKLQGSYGSVCGNSRAAWTSTMRSKEGFDKRYVRVNLELVKPHSSQDSTQASMSVKLGDIEVLRVASAKQRSAWSEKGMLELIPEVTDTDVIHVLWQGLEIARYTITGDKQLSISATGQGYVRVKDVRFKPIFSCEVENDEVVVRDSFNEGNTFNIHSLTYEPVKFCVDSYPAVIRDFGEERVAGDIHGDITRKIARGESVTVGDNQAIYFHYIADYVPGMGDPCGIAEVYDADKGECVTLIEEAKDIVVLVRDVIEVEVAQQERLFTGEEAVRSEVIDPKPCDQYLSRPLIVNVGNQVLEVGAPEFVCAHKETVYVSPDPESSCWKGRIKYDGDLFDAVYGEKVAVSDCVSVTYLPMARYDGGDDMRCVDDRHTVVKALVEIKMDECLDLMPKKNEYFTYFGKRTTAKYEVDNRIGAQFSDAGVMQRMTRDLLFSQEMVRVPFLLKEGLSVQSIDVDPSEYGEIFYQVAPYVVVDGQTYSSNKQLIYNFKVVDEDEDLVFCRWGESCEGIPEEVLEYADGEIDGLVEDGDELHNPVIEDAELIDDSVLTGKILLWGFLALLWLILVFIIIASFKRRK